MIMRRALGVHSFFAGFQLGLESTEDLNILGSVETWNTCKVGRELAGILTDPLPGWNGVTDVVFSNPPCSRYSSMSVSSYDTEEQSELGLFPELEYAVHTTLNTEAEMLWWETGPLLWSQGLEMVNEVHDALMQEWGGCTTVVVRYDPRWQGLHQRRPRCHQFHVRGLRDVAHLKNNWPTTKPLWPPMQSAYDWICASLKEQGAGIGINCVDRKLVSMDPLEAFDYMYDSGFVAGRPKKVTSTAAWLPAVTGRKLMWEELERFFGLHEYAALMTYPIWAVEPVGDTKGWQTALTLMSKSVAPATANWMWHNMGKQLLDSRTLEPMSNVRGRLMYLDMKLRDKPNKVRRRRR